MGDLVDKAAVFGRTVLAVLLPVLLLGGSVSAAAPDELSEQRLQALRAEAQQGDGEAQYRLGRYYRSSPRDKVNLVLAYSWFQMAERSGHRQAGAARAGLETVLRQSLSEEEFTETMAFVAEWSAEQGPPSQPGPSPGDAAKAAGEAAEKPVEASMEVSAGSEERGAAPAAETQQPQPEPQPQPQPQPEPQAQPAVPQVDMDELMTRGNAFLDTGNYVSARSFYTLAARHGSGDAAMLVGVTYDPGYYQLTGVVGLRPDAKKAAAWYAKAVDMGNQEAVARQQKLSEWLKAHPQ